MAECLHGFRLTETCDHERWRNVVTRWDGRWTCVKIKHKWEKTRNTREQILFALWCQGVGAINGTCICHNRSSFPMMAAVAACDAAASSLSPNLLDGVASPCCLGDGIAAAAAAAVVWPDRSGRTIDCGRDRVANDQSIPNDEYYGEATLLAFHRLLVAMDVRSWMKRRETTRAV